jgi:triosephosphate isomerase
LLFFINFKAYSESTSRNALKLVRSIENSSIPKESIVLVLNPLDSLIETRLTKYVQTAEPLDSGPFTGHIPIGVLKEYQYSGLMLNHSEHKISTEKIRQSIEMASRLGLRTLVCAADLEEIRNVVIFHPDFIAYEPPELIGGNTSVSTAKPEIIEEAAELLRGSGSKLIVGAGIKNREDIRASRNLGAEGVLVASGVVKSPDPMKVVVEMMKEVV